LRSVENQGFFSHRKATEKTTEKQQTLENQALAKILFGFSVLPKRPTHQARRPAHPLARFLQSRPSFFLYISVKLKN
jgi:hypothetical protein